MGFAHKRRVLPKRIRVDYETYSDADLLKCGAWRYAEDPSTRVLVATFEIDGKLLVWCPDPRFRRAPKHVTWVCRDKTFPKMILNALADGYRLVANNAEFEYVITKLVCGVKVTPDQFECMAAAQVYFRLSRHLDRAARSLGFQGKDDRGKDLIRLFCVPQVMGQGQTLNTINRPLTFTPKKKPRPQVPGQTDLFATATAVADDHVVGLTFDDLVAYNVQDVEQTTLIDNKIGPWWPASEVAVWQHTLMINERGLQLDAAYLTNIRWLQAKAPVDVRIGDRNYRYSVFGSVSEVKKILTANGCPIEHLDKNTVENLIAHPKTPEFVRSLLELRRDASRVSLGKLDVFTAYVSYDGILRGNYVYGGTDTLRWASWGVQVQNLPKPDKGVKSSECAAAIEARNLPALQKAGLGYHNRALVAGLAGVITAGKGNVFLKSDFAQIEARFVLWLADDHEHLDWWRQGRDMYSEMASKLFGREIKKGRDDKERDVGKRLILACNFQLGGDKFQDVEAVKYGIDLKALGLTGESAVGAFRAEFTSLSARDIGLWDRLFRAMCDVITNGGEVREAHLIFRKVGTAIWVELPSGRDYVFRDPRVVTETRVSKRTGRSYQCDVIYHTVETKHGPMTEDLYGGKLADLFTQASCRDLQALKMRQVEAAGLPVVAQVHDEVTSRCPEEKAKENLALQEKIMTTPEPWCPDFPIAVDSKISQRYMK